MASKMTNPANRFKALDEPEPSDATPVASVVTMSASEYIEKHDSKLGFTSFVTLLVAFIASGEQLRKSTKNIDKLAKPHLLDVFDHVEHFYTLIRDSSDRFGKAIKPLFFKPSEFVMIHSPDPQKYEDAKKKSNLTLTEADSTTLALAIQQRLRTIFGRLFGKYDPKTKKTTFSNNPKDWTADKLALMAGGISHDLLDEASDFLFYAHSIIGTDEDGISLFQFVRNAYYEASLEKQKFQQSLPKIVSKTVERTVKNPYGEVETQTRVIRFRVRPRKPETDKDGFVRLVHDE